MDRANMDLLKDFAKKFNMAPEEVAKTAVDGMFKGELEIVPGFTNKISAIGTKFLPKKINQFKFLQQWKRTGINSYLLNSM